MSEKISAVTATTTLADEDLFALAKFTGSGPTGFGSRHITAADLLAHVEDNADLTTNTSVINLIDNSISTTTTTEITEGDNLYLTQPRLRTAVEPETVSFTLELADADHKWKTLTSISACTITVPPQTDVAWPANTYIELMQGGNGQVTIVAGTGVTVRVNENLLLELNGDYAVAALKRIAEDEWVAFGNLVPA